MIHILGIWAFAITASQRTHRLLINKVGGVLVLSCALSACHLAVLKSIHPLTAEHSMVVGGGERIGHILLNAQTIAAVLGLSVNGVAGDADDRISLVRGLCHKGEIVASCARSG